MVREYKAPSNNHWRPDDKSGEYVVIYPGGIKQWYKDGKRHREYGPAIEYANGHKVYYYESQFYPEIESDEEWKNFLKLKFLW